VTAGLTLSPACCKVTGMAEEKFQLALVAAALSADPREAARASRSAGFRGLQFDAFAPALDLTELSQTGRREFRRVLSSADQQLIALRVDVGPKGFGPGADVDRLLSRFEKVMEAAKGLSAPLVCVEAGPLPEPAATEKPKPKITQQQAGLLILPEPATTPQPAESRPVPGPTAAPDPALISHVDTALSALGVRADRLGVTLAFRSDLASFAALDRALAAAACPWFGVDLDPVAILRDGWSSDEIFSRLGHLIRHVRARDAVVGSDRRTRPAVIGQGSVSWEELLSNLDAAGYRGWLTIDPLELPDRPAAAVAGAKHLRTLLRSP
jgi:sugar phosphate isomerase/epimerase